MNWWTIIPQNSSKSLLELAYFPFFSSQGGIHLGILDNTWGRELQVYVLYDKWNYECRTEWDCLAQLYGLGQCPRSVFVGEITVIHDFSCKSLLMEYSTNLKNDYADKY